MTYKETSYYSEITGSFFSHSPPLFRGRINRVHQQNSNILQPTKKSPLLIVRNQRHVKTSNNKSITQHKHTFAYASAVSIEISSVEGSDGEESWPSFAIKYFNN